MSEDHFVRFVFFEQLGKQTVLAAEIKRRIMDHRNQLVPLSFQSRRAAERQTEPLRFPNIQFSVLFALIGTARTRPPARAYDDVFPDSHSVRL